MVDNEISDRISQGDIYKDIEIIEKAQEENGKLIIEKIKYPYVIVITQDCDLEQDNRVRKKKENKEKISDDKILLSVIVVPLYNSEHFKQGLHLSELNMEMQVYSRKDFQKITQNVNPRYHYLEFSEEVSVVNSVIDFKHYFTVNRNYLEQLKSNNICKVSELFREQISHRFAHYLSRIGLPEIDGVTDDNNK